MGFELTDRDIRLATAALEPSAINSALAAFAKQELRRVVSSGQASSTYTRHVNGMKGAPEEAVKAPGPIVYEFVNWPLVIRAAMEELQRRSPRRTGRYASGFIVLADQRVVRDYGSIPGDAEVVIFNVRPYTRRIETGANKSSGRKHFDGTKAALARRFREGFTFRTMFLNVAPGIHPQVPYRLKGGGRRKGRQAGDLLTYPAIVMNANG